MTTPDISVIVPVYNTMPYLTACLDSLVEQTIGLDRVQVVAVDDGSTDGSGDELDRFAMAHPGSFTVIHQANSGGPAGPCNRGLDVATGRYVFFLGADDYMGLEALERLVGKADAWGSDVLLGRIQGVNGRFVDQTIYKASSRDIDLYHSHLPFAISNTKLFRRELIERWGIRYPESLRVGSDQPFSLEAMIRAARISVMAGYTCVYGVKRHDATNITYSSSWSARLEDIGTVMHHVADLVPEGEQRDAILRRHFAWELAKLLRLGFTELESDDQRALMKGVGRLADEFLTPGLSRSLWASARLRIRLAQAGDLDHLLAVIGYQQSPNVSPLVLEGDRVYVWFPGFRDARGLPDEWFELTNEGTWDRLAKGFDVADAQVQDGSLCIAGEIGLTVESAPHAHFVLLSMRAKDEIPRIQRYERGTAPTLPGVQVALRESQTGHSSELRAEIPLDEMLASDLPAGRKWAVRLRVDVGEWSYDLPARIRLARSETLVRRGRMAYSVVVRTDDQNFLFMRRKQIPLGDFVRVRLGRGSNQE